MGPLNTTELQQEGLIFPARHVNNKKLYRDGDRHTEVQGERKAPVTPCINMSPHYLDAVFSVIGSQ